MRSRSSPLARPELAALVEVLARRFGDGDPPVTVSLRELPEETRAALADLLGLDRVPRATGRIQVSRLVRAVGLDSVTALRAAVESVHGPVPDRRAARLADQAARDDLWAWAAEQVASLPFGSSGARAQWVDGLRSQGIRGGLDVHRRRLEDAFRVLRALPADGVPLAAFAADTLDDPHGLDRGRRLSAMVLDAVALASGAPPATDAEAVRLLWEAVGVAPDPLSSTVLAVGLPSNAPAPLGPWSGASAVASEPVMLTLAQLRRWPFAPLPADGVVFVVENPSLIAEAARRGWPGPPLVCSSGRPTVAVVTLLRQLGARGASLQQHADFDATGLSITAWLADRAGTMPWRMSASDYTRAVVERSGAAGLIGTIPPTTWDPSLAEAMGSVGRPVYEEELRDDLLRSMVQPT